MDIFDTTHFLLIVNYIVFAEADCDGFQKCCVGFMWNENLRSCTKCDVGYTGRSCDQKCPYPTYGEICQQTCKCNESLCSFSTGCKLEDHTLSSFSTPITTATRLVNSGNISTFTMSAQPKTNTPQVQNKTALWSFIKSDKETDWILTHPIVIALFVFNMFFVGIILLFIAFICRRVRHMSRTCDILNENNTQGNCVKEEKTMCRSFNQHDSLAPLLQSTIAHISNSSTALNNLRTKEIPRSGSPSENAEYTDTKSVYTEMSSIPPTHGNEEESQVDLQNLRRPCQSVDDNVYTMTDNNVYTMTDTLTDSFTDSFTDTQRFDSETDTKDFRRNCI